MEIKSKSLENNQDSMIHQKYVNQIEELTKDIERKEQALTEKHIILSHDACKDKIEELKSIIRSI